MAPNAKPSRSKDSIHTSSTIIPNAAAAVVPERNVTSGVNYPLSTEPVVHDVVSQVDSTNTATVADSTNTKTTRIYNGGSDTNTCPCRSATTTAVQQQTQQQHQQQHKISPPSTIRKSRRQPKPKAAFMSLLSPSSNNSQKSRVRYDMNLVPIVKKNQQFVQHWRSNDENENNYVHLAPKKRDRHDATLTTPNKVHPFDGDETVVWIPTNRSQWEDSLSELTAVCKSAAWRKYQMGSNNSNNHSQDRKPFYAPLSPDYIRDRIDIDDPLIGYQFRHAVGGWLQGFLMLTNFTTWSHYFKWDSCHAASGVPVSTSKENEHIFVDTDGSLSSQLERQPRSGDPLGGGIVSASIAEISLVGGLACGEYLLRMALDDVAARKQYDYVVLQATESSRSFYESFGFVRVGAISRYGPRKAGRQATNQEQLSDLTGYRHWTYAHESTKSLGKHGGPSYMMARRVDRSSTKESFLKTMKQFAVMDKPKVKQLGAATTPLSKKNIITMLTSPSSMSSSVPQLPNLQELSSATSSKKSCKRRRSSTSSEASSSLIEVAAKVSHKRRAKTNTVYQFMQQRDDLLAPPVKGKALSYAQKQYQSVWLAVSPKTETPTRRPPRKRGDLSSTKETATTTMAGLGTVDAAIKNESPGVVLETTADPVKRSHQDDKDNVPGASVRKQKSSRIPKRIPKEQHFFNKVVQLEQGSNDMDKYFYVLFFDMKDMTLKLVPMARDDDDDSDIARPRWKAQVDEQALIDAAKKYKIVASHVLTKTPLVANERWDILQLEGKEQSFSC